MFSFALFAAIVRLTRDCGKIRLTAAPATKSPAMAGKL